MKNDLSNNSEFIMATRKDLVNAIRALAMDAVQKANSGHPGMPMGMAEIGEVLWSHHLRHNPANPNWVDRDRFVVSNGHGSMLLYALLHLTGYDLPLQELKDFRQLHSKTPGHPEYGTTAGVEATTGPLGQGLANAIGMALAERILADEFNRPWFEIVNHYTYVLVGDGCLMEGISHEACSLAGTLGLGKLIVLYDDNGISIDGPVEGWFTDDTPKRFGAYGWHVVPAVDGHDSDAVDAAIKAAKAEHTRPSLICCKTIIGKGAPNKGGTHEAHGAPLGEKEVAAAREVIGWRYPPFEIPPDIYAGWDARKRGAELEAAWEERFAAYANSYPEVAAEFRRWMTGELPEAWGAEAAALIARAAAKKEACPTRKASQHALDALSKLLPELVGGSADLSGSNLTQWFGSHAIGKSGGGNYIHYGVREFAMTAIVTGLALHGGVIPFGATFLMFSDYARNALRMAALMKIRAIQVYTHDSIGVGEDGPTHHPIEQVAGLRLIPNMHVWRPADSVETMVAWIAAIERRNGPTSLILTRQKASFFHRDAQTIENVRRGGYVLAEAQGGKPAVVLIATGSEVALAMDAATALAKEGIAARVVSMPSMEVFAWQDPDYKAKVLPKGVKRVAIEAGVTETWNKYVGPEGAAVGIDVYGESAPPDVLFKHFGFTVENVVSTVKRIL